MCLIDRALYSYDGDSDDLTVASSGGGGLLTIAGAFESSRVMYGFCSMKDATAALPRYVLINWVGEDVPDARKCACAIHVATVAEFFQGVNVIVNASNMEDIEPSAIGQRLTNGTTAVASPVLNRLRTKEGENGENVGTVYTKTNAEIEMKKINREEFWEKAKREEELRKEEDRKRVAEERQRFEEERMELEKKEQEERERRYREREREIEEQRPVQSVAPQARDPDPAPWGSATDSLVDVWDAAPAAAAPAAAPAPAPASQSTNLVDLMGDITTETPPPRPQPLLSFDDIMDASHCSAPVVEDEPSSLVDVAGIDHMTLSYQHALQHAAGEGPEGEDGKRLLTNGETALKEGTQASEGYFSQSQEDEFGQSEDTTAKPTPVFYNKPPEIDITCWDNDPVDEDDD
uniref:Drebrin 1 n=1 Tax=Gadus morhua TaxID=8049 RepID=A0A8C4ZH89_GADMO